MTASSTSGSSAQKTAAIAAMGVGAAGLALGTIMGVMTLSKKSDFTKSCDAKSCSPDAQSDYDKAVSYSTWSTVGLVAGAGLVGVGVVLLAAAPKSGATETGPARPPISARVELSPGLVSLRGSF